MLAGKIKTNGWMGFGFKLSLFVICFIVLFVYHCVAEFFPLLLVVIVIYVFIQLFDGADWCGNEALTPKKR